MSFTNKEPLQPKLTAMPASKDVEALVMTSKAASSSARFCPKP